MISKGGPEGGMMAEINLTSLIDVMLPQTLGVKLPKTDSVQASLQPSSMHLVLNSNGQLQLDGQTVEDAALRAMLSNKKDDAEFQLQIEADENLRYGRLAEVMALAQSAGVKKLSFVTLTRPK